MFRNMEPAGTSNINEHVINIDNNFDPKAVDVKVERVSDDELELEIEFDRTIKEEVVERPEETSSKEMRSKPSQQHTMEPLSSCTGSECIKLETEEMPTVKQEQTEELHAECKIKYEIGIEPVVPAAHVKEENDASLTNKQRIETENEKTDLIKKATEIITYNVSLNNIQTKRNTKPSDGNFRKTLGNNKTPRPSCNVFTCNYCGENFTKKLKLVKHIESHEKIKHDIFLKCEDCTYQTVTREVMERHKKVHDKSRRFVCDVCGYRFKYKCVMQAHWKIVHSDEKIHECGVCDYRTKRVDHLNAHMKIHSGDKPFACTLCGYKCYVKNDLTKHERIHTGDKPYCCTVCNYKCSTQCNLTSHLRIHSGVKPFSCTMCEYKCNTKTTLKIHLRIHSGEKPFKCSVCDCKFTVKCNLNRHIKTHEGKEPYSCTTCQYKCNSKAALKTHVRIHTGP